MRKNYFFEGFILGAVTAVLGWLLFCDTQCGEACEPAEEKPTEPEDKVNKTLDAIEKGFENISSMINESKKK